MPRPAHARTHAHRCGRRCEHETSWKRTIMRASAFLRLARLRVASSPRVRLAVATTASTTALSLAIACDDGLASRCEPLLQQTESNAPLLFSWGRLAPASDPDTPVRLKTREPIQNTFWASRGLRIVQFSFGATHGAALDDKGGLWAWGEASGPVPQPLPCGRDNVTKLASSSGALYALTSRGRVLEWRDLDASLAASGTSPPAPPAPLGGALSRMTATSLAAGDNHLLVVGSQGEVAALGDNKYGQLGITPDPESMPCANEAVVLKTLPKGARVTQAACGAAHSLLLLSDGSVLAFGDDHNLQLGLRARTIKAMKSGRMSVPTPERIQLLPRDQKVVGIAAGGGGIEGGHSIFLLHNAAGDGDELWACGYGRWGQLGTKAYTHQSEPAILTGLSRLREYDEVERKVMGVRVVELACGERHTAALLATGNVFVWGWNDHGQLGSGGKQGTHTPTLVKSPPELRFSVMKHLACGPNSTAVWN